jgi:hypothetical protein
MSPGLSGRKTKVTKLHGAVIAEKDVLWLDVAMVETLGVHVLDSTDQLHHEAANVVCLERSTVNTDGLVKVTHWAELQDKEHVSVGLERVDQVHNVWMVPENVVACELDEVVLSKGRRLLRVVGSLGQTLDGNLLVGLEVLGQEDHAKGAVVEWRDGFETIVQKGPLNELLLHAKRSHGELIEH